MGQAIFTITKQLLASLLHLPESAEILHVMPSSNPQAFKLVIQSPELPEVKMGDYPPQIEPRVTYRWDWGLVEEEEPVGEEEGNA